MSALIEHKAKEYLLNQFKSKDYKFSSSPKKSGYDLIMHNLKNSKTTKIELKATAHEYTKAKVFTMLVFNTKNEAELFITGKTKVLRLFMGNEPHVLKLFDNTILDDNVKIVVEYRSTIKGKKDHSKIIDIK